MRQEDRVSDAGHSMTRTFLGHIVSSLWYSYMTPRFYEYSSVLQSLTSAVVKAFSGKYVHVEHSFTFETYTKKLYFCLRDFISQKVKVTIVNQCMVSMFPAKLLPSSLFVLISLMKEVKASQMFV